jgi:serine/threonine protein kinase
MSCISYDKFSEKYHLGRFMRSGAYGKVFETSDGKYVVKGQSFHAMFVKEVCILSQFSHPNLIGVEDISFTEEGYTWYAMAKGEDLWTAYHSGKITIRSILSDLFSVFAFFEKNGIVHADLKPQNIVFHEGRVKVIDLGIAKFAELYDDGYMFRGPAYTIVFRDPEYDSSFVTPASIKCEVYSIATTIYFFLLNRYPKHSDRPFYVSRQQYEDVGIHEEDILDLLENCQQFLSERKTISELLSHPALESDRLIPPQRFSPPDYRVSDIEGFPGNDVKEWARKMSVKRVSCRVILLSIDLFARYILNGGTPSKRNFVAARMIASCFLDGPISTNKHTLEDFRDEVCSYYETLHGVFFNDTSYLTVRTKKDLSSIVTSYQLGIYDSTKRYASQIGEEIDRSQFRSPFGVYADAVVAHPYATFAIRSTPSSFDLESIAVDHFFRDKQHPDFFVHYIYFLLRGRHQLSHLSLEKARFYLRLVVINTIDSSSDVLSQRLLKEKITDATPFESVNAFSLSLSQIHETMGIEISPALDIVPSIDTDEQLMMALQDLHYVTIGDTQVYTLRKDGHKITTFMSTSPASALMLCLNFLRDIEPSTISQAIDNLKTYPNLQEWVDAWFKPSAAYHMTK